MSYLKDIAVFVKVVDCGSFAAAARDLGLVAPSVSKQVARLEAELGLPLIHRTTHNLFLTDAGREFYNRCVRGLAEIEDARAVATSLNQDLKGTLRVHTTLSVGQALIGPALLDFMDKHPAIHINLDMGSVAINPIEQQYDLTIRTKRIREKSPGHVSIGRRILAPVRQVVVASPDYLAAHGKPKRLQDLPERRCLVHYTQSTNETWVFHSAAGETTIRIDPALRSNNWMSVRDGALAGLGLARLPDFCVRREIEAGQLVALFSDQVRSDQQVQALFPRSERMPAKLRLLLDYLTDRLKGNAAS